MGSDLVTDAELEKGEVDPKTLVSLIRRETSHTNGYLHPFFCRQKRAPTTLKGLLGWISGFFAKLKGNSTYYAGRPDKQEHLNDCVRLLDTAKRRLKKPIQMHKIKHREISKKDLIPAKHIREFIDSNFLKDCEEKMKDREQVSVFDAITIHYDH